MAPDDTKHLNAPEQAVDQKPSPAGPRSGRDQGRDQAGDTPRCHVTSRISPITRRILAVNVLALGILVAGLLYLGDYREKLIDSELENLRTQAEMFAAALGEGAVGGDTPFGQELVRDTANRIVLRMVESTDLRARLFRIDGTLVADSRKLLKAGREVEVEILPPPKSDMDVFREVFDVFDRLIRWLPGQHPPPLYVERPLQHARHYPEVIEAFDGETVYAVRSLDLDHLILTVAVPVQRYKQVLGALLLSEASYKIDDAMLEVRLDILKIFLVSLGVTILLSIYLAGTIARPLRRLSMAADRVGRSLNRQDQLPAMDNRGDEIGDLACTLRDMMDALWRRMDAIERFAADVSHEIKNPLTSLKSAVETAARVTDPDQQRKLLSIIQEDVERLDRLITDISNASRLDAELSRMELSSVDLGLMLETLVDVHTSTSKPAAPRIVLETAAEGPFIISGMEDRMVQVFRNLLGNAISFSPPDGTISIAIRHETPDKRTKNVVVTLSDEGPGIPPGKEQAIFERFYSERPEGEKFGTHSGLGLSISQQIIDAHHGTLVAENRYGAGGAIIGARFIVTLPVAS